MTNKKHQSFVRYRLHILRNKCFCPNSTEKYMITRPRRTDSVRTLGPAYLKWSLTTRLIKPSISLIYGLDFFPWYSAIEKSSLCIVKIIASIESETDENNGKSIEPVNSSFRAFKNHKNYLAGSKETSIIEKMHPTLPKNFKCAPNWSFALVKIIFVSSDK